MTASPPTGTSLTSACWPIPAPALVIAEATDVERHGRISHGCLGLYSDACEEALARVVAHCRRIGTAKLGIQIAHAGRKGSAPRAVGRRPGAPPGADPWETIAPSAMPFGPSWAIPRAMTTADIERMRDAFMSAAAARGARRLRRHRAARSARLSAAQLRLADLQQAQRRLWRLARKRACAFRSKWRRHARGGAEAAIPLGARITGSDWMDGGLTPDDAVVFAKALKARRARLSCASPRAASAANRGRPQSPASTCQFAEKVKREVGIPTRTVGLIATPKQAEAIVAEGKADMVALGRAFLDDPHWGWHAATALGAEVARPQQYLRAAPKMWPGASYRDQ